MYKILVDDSILYHPTLEDYEITACTCEMELNKAGTLTLVIPSSNPHYGMANLKKSIITLLDDGKVIFRGRPYAPGRNLYKDNEIVCEGELSFFNDTYQLPFDFYGTVEDLFEDVITFHNSQVSEEKQFNVGTVSITKNTLEGYITRSSVDYMTTWEFIEENFLDLLGGYLHLRHEADGVYIDYLQDLNFVSTQEVRQCLNLIEVSEEVDTEELATVVVPIGGKIKNAEGNDTEACVTIEDVNEGKIYLADEDAVAEYGWIIKIVKHDDITEPLLLKTAGAKDLAEASGVATTIDISAADLSTAGYNVDPFAFGTYVPVKISNLDIDQNMLVRKMKIDVLNPQSSTLSVGDTYKTMTAKNLSTDKTISIISNTIAEDKIYVQQTINQVKKEMSSNLQQTEQSILSTVSESYYNREDTEELIRELSTEIEQNAGGIEIRFQQLQGQISDVGNEVIAQNQYIRLENGEVIIGRSGSPIVSVYTNDSLEFRYNGLTVAKFSNEVLEVKNIWVQNQLKLHEQWAMRRGAHVEGIGYNLDDVWIGG